MANDHIGPELQMLLDKQSIRELLATYCRAVDRLDRELLLTVYHPDAIDDHGIFTGCAEGFADWAFAHHTNSHYATQHIITNHLCEIEGDTAHSETYWTFAAMNKAGAPLSLSGGRYVDRFERRDGRWAIALRKSVCDWYGAPGASALPDNLRAALNGAGTVSRDHGDLSYERPLTILPNRSG